MCAVSIAHPGRLLFAGLAVAFAPACAAFPDSPPETDVVLENQYAPETAFVIYDAQWLNVSFAGIAVPPGFSSPPESTVPASADNTAYAALAPGWDPAGDLPPQTLVVLQSRQGFAVGLGDTLRLRVNDATFEGNCDAGSQLTPAQADFLTQIVFSADFEDLSYDPATCTTTQIGDAGGP